MHQLINSIACDSNRPDVLRFCPISKLAHSLKSSWCNLLNIEPISFFFYRFWFHFLIYLKFRFIIRVSVSSPKSQAPICSSELRILFFPFCFCISLRKWRTFLSIFVASHIYSSSLHFFILPAIGKWVTGISKLDGLSLSLYLFSLFCTIIALNHHSSKRKMKNILSLFSYRLYCFCLSAMFSIHNCALLNWMIEKNHKCEMPARNDSFFHGWISYRKENRFFSLSFFLHFGCLSKNEREGKKIR